MSRVQKLLPLLLVALVALPLRAATTRNDDSCDLGVFPAATLLLPYFEVDLASSAGASETTIFAITNTGAMPQAARVTLWTDYGYPVVSFNLYLTGYDVQKINLFDVIGHGIISPGAEIGSADSPLGELSGDDNPRLDEDTCLTVPSTLPAALVQRMKTAFTLGRVGEECIHAGNVHTRAMGYATIDVVAACTNTLPTDPSYFSHEIRFDNVLTGDYIQIGGDDNYAQGNPMVHIRAIPEGGQTSTRRKTNLARTFYSRYQPGATRTADARQPLPSQFAARWISGGPTGFETFYKVWREAATTSATECDGFLAASTIKIDAVRFDEDENPELFVDLDPLHIVDTVLPAAALVNVGDESVFPENTTGSVAGWMYINLHDPRSSVATQNWVTTSMRAENRFSTDVDAIPLGNGCSAPNTKTRASVRAGIIGPSPNTNR